MDQWKGRVAVVTGASSGLGADFVKQLACKKVIVVGLARRKERMDQLIIDFGKNGNIHAIKCDISDEKQVAEAFEWIDENLGAISILINNAGILRTGTFQGKGDPSGWKEQFDTNVLGMSYCIRYGLQNMLKHKIDDGHIININSICGHDMPIKEWIHNTMYNASKHAVRIMTDGLRKELVLLNSKIRASSISPGVVRTEIFDASGDLSLNGDWFSALPTLEPENITHALFYILSAPLVVNIAEIIIKPTGENL